MVFSYLRIFVGVILLFLFCVDSAEKWKNNLRNNFEEDGYLKMIPEQHESTRRLDSKTTREIFFVGDSLISVPETLFTFSNKIKDKLDALYPAFEIKVKTLAQRSFTMHNISTGLQRIMNAREISGATFPDIVFIYSYNDMLNEFNRHPRISTMQSTVYRKNLVHLLKYLHSRVDHVAVMGPTSFGPTGEMSNEWNDIKNARTQYVTAFGRINKEACESYSNAYYIDSRTSFQESITKMRTKAKDLSGFVGLSWDKTTIGGLLTFDGEHTNEKGTDLLISLFIERLQKWEVLWDTSEIDVKRKTKPADVNTDKIKVGSKSKGNFVDNREQIFIKELLEDHDETDDEFTKREDVIAGNSDSKHERDDEDVSKSDGSEGGTESDKEDGDHDLVEIGEDGLLPSDPELEQSEGNSTEDDRGTWSPEKRSCFEWRDTYGVLVGVSWGKLPFELQGKWELYNCNDYMDCHTAACAYHSGTLEHFNKDHPIFQRPQSAADWEIANGFIPSLAKKKTPASSKRKKTSHVRVSDGA